MKISLPSNTDLAADHHGNSTRVEAFGSAVVFSCLCYIYLGYFNMKHSSSNVYIILIL